MAPRKPIDIVFDAAEAVQKAYAALNSIPFGQRHELDTLLDGPVFPGDLDVLAKKLNAIADEWQDELSEAEEADDRRRANPLSPDYRRLA